MTRLTRILLFVILLELISVAVGLPLARWPAIADALSGDGGVRKAERVRLAIAFGSPLVLLAAWAAFERRLASPTRRLSATHRGYAEAGLVAAAFFLIAYQGWFASHLGQGVEASASRELILRAGAIFAGMLMAVQGNFSAKSPAPQDAPIRQSGRRQSCGPDGSCRWPAC